MLNTKKIEDAMASAKITKAEMFKRTGIGRTTFDAILSGSDARISTIEKIAKVLGVRVGYFFDEETLEVRQAGRDYVENDNSQHSGTEYHANEIRVGDGAVLAEKVKALEALLAEKERTIQILLGK